MGHTDTPPASVAATSGTGSRSNTAHERHGLTNSSHCTQPTWSTSAQSGALATHLHGRRVGNAQLPLRACHKLLPARRHNQPHLHVRPAIQENNDTPRLAAPCCCAVPHGARARDLEPSTSTNARGQGQAHTDPARQPRACRCTILLIAHKHTTITTKSGTTGQGRQAGGRRRTPVGDPIYVSFLSW